MAEEGKKHHPNKLQLEASVGKTGLPQLITNCNYSTLV
jgi:hypothetical protein